MTLDDETASRIANETWAKRGKRHTVSGEEYVRAGYAARDAEVEELRTRLVKVREWADEHPSTGTLLAILDESPTDALRAVKAEVWSEGYEVGRGERRWCVNPYRDEEEVVPDDRA